MPLGLSFLLIIFFLIKKNKLAIYLSVFLIWIFSIEIVSNKLARIIEYPYEKTTLTSAPEADAIVVLSGNLSFLKNNEIEFVDWKDPDRVFAGINLFKKGKAKSLIFTGGFNPFFNNEINEGIVYKDLALNFGIPQKFIKITPNVINTQQEAIEIASLLRNKLNLKDPNIILVTSVYHMKRAEYLFEKQGLKVYPFPVDFTSIRTTSRNTFLDPYLWYPNASNLSKSSKFIREILGRIYYRINYYYLKSS